MQVADILEKALSQTEMLIIVIETILQAVQKDQKIVQQIASATAKEHIGYIATHARALAAAAVAKRPDAVEELRKIEALIRQKAQSLE